MTDELTDPTPEPEPATAGAALADANAAASAQAAESLKSAVAALAESIKSGKATIDAAAAAASAPRPAAPPVAPTPVFGPEVLAEMCEKAGLPREAAGVFVEFARNVVAPVYSSQITAEAKRSKREAERDATPAYDNGPTLGALYLRYKPEVERLIQERGVTDAYLAEHGYTDLVRLAANADPKYFDERVTAEAARRAPAPAPAAPAPAAAGPAPRPPVEGVATPGAPTSRAAKTRAEQIAAVPTTREEEELHRVVFRMTPSEVKQQKLEIAEWQHELGPIGLKQAGGIPICRLEDMFGGAVREA